MPLPLGGGLGFDVLPRTPSDIPPRGGWARAARWPGPGSHSKSRRDSSSLRHCSPKVRIRISETSISVSSKGVDCHASARLRVSGVSVTAGARRTR